MRHLTKEKVFGVELTLAYMLPSRFRGFRGYLATASAELGTKQGFLQRTL